MERVKWVKYCFKQSNAYKQLNSNIKTNKKENVKSNQLPSRNESKVNIVKGSEMGDIDRSMVGPSSRLNCCNAIFNHHAQSEFFFCLLTSEFVSLVHAISRLDQLDSV
jgi:hypothetical protein